jgi:COP9 signalosome complex subunit 3
LNTVPYVYILLANLNASQKVGKTLGWDKLWDKITKLLEFFDTRQILYLGKEFTHIIDAAVSYARSSHQVRLLSLGAKHGRLTDYRLLLQ